MSNIRFLLFVGMSLCVNEVALAKLILSAPPREDVKSGEEYYGPIAAELSKLLGEEVVYKHPVNWVNYTREMRLGKYDLVFDGPHFASWRMQHVGHVPVAKLSGHLQFYILTKKDDHGVKTMQDLLSKSFCGLASPNLGTMSAFDLYNNPIVQPEIQIVKGSMKEVMKKFLSGECRAAVVRDTLYLKLSQADKDKIRIVAKSRKMPNQSITVSNRISAAKREKIVGFLTSEHGAKTASKLLARFSGKQKYFISTNTEEFDGLNELLEGVVYGW